jgi:hypothetical protein
LDDWVVLIGIRFYLNKNRRNPNERLIISLFHHSNLPEELGAFPGISVYPHL